MAADSAHRMPSWASEVEEEHQRTGWDNASTHSEETWPQCFKELPSPVPKTAPKSKKSKKKPKAGAVSKQTESNAPLLPSSESKTRAVPDSVSVWELPARGRGNGKAIQAQNRPPVDPRQGAANLNAKGGQIRLPQSSSNVNGKGAQVSSKAALETGSSPWELKQAMSALIQSKWVNSDDLSEDHNAKNSENLPITSTDSASSVLDALLPLESLGLPEVFGVAKRPHSCNDGPTNCNVEPAFMDVYSSAEPQANGSKNLDSDDDDLESDSDWISGEDDSDGSEKSHEMMKANKVHRAFFQILDDIPQADIDNEERQWHCPVCKGGPGAIDWYRGFQPLLNHAKTVKKKVHQHRIFFKVLDAELSFRHSSQPTGMFGMWKGLKGDDEIYNPLIIWPPMVVIQNTKLELDAQEKWIGMGNKELQDHFKEWNVSKTKHAYGPMGHCGMSMLIFAESPAGYYEALRLDQRFRDDRRGREFWDKPSKLLFYHGGQRILYGYLAIEEDLKIFNRHSKGKAALKYDLRWLREVVVEPLRNMDEGTQQLYKLKNKVEREKEISKNLEKALTGISRKLRLREEEVIVLNERALEQTNDNQTQMDDLELHQRRLEDVILSLRQKLLGQENDMKAMQNRALDQLKQNKEEIEALEHSYHGKICQLRSGISEKEQAMHKVQEKFQDESFQRYQELEQQHSTLCLNMGQPESNEQKKQAKLEEMSLESQKIEMSLKDVKEYEELKMQLEDEHHARRLQFKRKQLEEEMAFQQKLEEEKLKLLESWKERKPQDRDTVGCNLSVTFL